MKILLVTNWQCGLFRQAFSYHGDWVITFEVALALRACGAQVGIVARRPLTQHRARFRAEFGQALADASVQMFFAASYSPHGATRWVAKWHLATTLLRAIRRFQPDVIQFWETSPLFPRWLVRRARIVSVVQARFRTRIPHANRSKDKEAMAGWGAGRLPLRKRFLGLVIRVINKLWKLDLIDEYARHCDCLVTNHAATYRRLRTKWPSVIHYIPKGIGLSAAEAHKPCKGYPSSRLEVLFMGVICHGKGVFDLIRAFEQVSRALPSAYLTIVGIGPPGMMAKARDLIRRGNLTSAVTMVGSVGYQEKWRYHWGCDVFCLPSYGDVYPGAMNEAFTCGKPVITTDQVDDWVVDGYSGLRVPAGDVDALAQALLKLLRDDDLRRRMGTAARVVAEAYSLEDMAEAFIDLYDGLLGQKR